jgi:saccharopine dehydrogenase-like NADP-dependent oxidoreductase
MAKTLRYPCHIEEMAALRESGFFDDEEIDVGGRSVRRIDVKAELLFPMRKLQEAEAYLTAIQVEVVGTSNNQHTKYVFDLLGRYDQQVTSMTRNSAIPRH